MSPPTRRVSRLLVALFNLMQGKEFAGQERAAGAAAFAGTTGRAGEQGLLHLIEAQEACFERFETFCPPDTLASWRAAQAAMPLAELRAPLRRKPDRRGAGHRPGACAGRSLVRVLFAASRPGPGGRIGARHRACARRAQRIAALQVDPDDPQAVLEELVGRSDAAAPLGMLVAGETPAGDPVGEGARAPAVAAELLGPRLTRSIVDVLHAQSRRLQAMSDELAVRATSTNAS